MHSTVTRFLFKRRKADAEGEDALCPLCPCAASALPTLSSSRQSSCQREGSGPGLPVRCAVPCAWAGMNPVPGGVQWSRGEQWSPHAALWCPLPVSSVTVKIGLCIICPNNLASLNSNLWNLGICWKSFSKLTDELRKRQGLAVRRSCVFGDHQEVSHELTLLTSRVQLMCALSLL